MRVVLIAVVLAVAAACQRIEEPERTSTGCEVRATRALKATKAEYTVEAVSTGPDCDRAVAMIVIRDGTGVPLYAEAHMAIHIMMLARARDAAAMQAALAEWITPDGAMTTSSALPDWPENAQGPESGEFSFYPEAGYDRASYMTLRRKDLPLFCYVQGMESMSCLALGEGSLDKVGVQTFPG